MTVSNEDREAAIAAAALAIAQGYQDEAKYFRDDATDAVAALVSHGWGPRPTVSRARIDEYMDAAIVGRGVSASAAVRELLRECGIEVTDQKILAPDEAAKYLFDAFNKAGVKQYFLKTDEPGPASNDD